METVAICVCTLDREKLLERCLDSVSKMTLPDTLAIFLLIVDNDCNGSSRKLVEQFDNKVSFPVHYLKEVRRGIPFARNAAIEAVIQADADYLIFIDDDEIVDEAWLVNLYSYAASKGGKAVVHGAVESILPSDTPEHLKKLFKSQKRKTGELLQVCATDNVIIPAYVFGELGLRFDTSQPLAGGTDTKFFTEAVSHGVEIFQCSEALVVEYVPRSRSSIIWLTKRKYRAGITECWRKTRVGKSKSLILGSALFHVLIEGMKCVVFGVLLQKQSAYRSWLKSCKYVGVLVGWLGFSIDSYKEIDS